MCFGFYEVNQLTWILSESQSRGNVQYIHTAASMAKFIFASLVIIMIIFLNHYMQRRENL